MILNEGKMVWDEFVIYFIINKILYKIIRKQFT
jgi:hypothetical protein